MKTPRADIVINGNPVGSLFNERLISVTLVDKEGVTSDTISCDLNDSQPFAAIPRKGDIITAAIGYRETGVLPFGRYTADDPEVRCLPYGLTVNGKGTDMREKLKQHGARHWDRKSVKDIVSDIAGQHGLAAKVDATIGAHIYEWFGQEDESDLHLIERLARRHDALFSIKNGALIFAAKGSGRSASGAELTPVLATPANIVSGTCSVTFANRNSFANVKAHAQNRKTAGRDEVRAKSDDKGEADFTLAEPFADKDEAKRAATAKAKELKAQTITTSVTLVGDPTIRAGAPLIYAGVRPEVDGIAFVIETATHTLSKSGYTTAVEAKLGEKGEAGA